MIDNYTKNNYALSLPDYFYYYIELTISHRDFIWRSQTSIRYTLRQTYVMPLG